MTNGWPSDKSIFDHAAYEILKFHADHKDEYTNKITNPGLNGLTKADQNAGSGVSPEDGAKYPELEELENYKKGLAAVDPNENRVNRI